MHRLEDMTEQELSELLGKMARAIVETARLNDVEKPLFVLLVFNDPKVAQYVANGTRADIIKAMREAAERLENRQDVPR